jgi:hypothetical protein
MDIMDMGHDRRSAAGEARYPLRGALVQNDGIKAQLCPPVSELPLPYF